MSQDLEIFLPSMPHSHRSGKSFHHATKGGTHQAEVATRCRKAPSRSRIKHKKLMFELNIDGALNELEDFSTTTAP